MTDPTRRLVRELVDLRTSHGSSVYEIRTEDLTTTLTVVDGVVVSVRASKPGDPLGRILVRKRLLTQDQYVEVLERMSSVLALGEKIRFGEVAVELGYVKEEGVRQCLAEQLRLLASRVFQHASPTWTTSELPAGRDASYDVAMPVEALFLDAVRWVDDARKGALALDEARSLALRPAWPLDQIDARFDLTSDEADFARSALGGDTTVAALLDDGSTPDTVDAHAILTALVATGAASALVPGVALRHAASLRPAARKVPPPLPDWAIDAAGAQTALARIVLAKVSVPAPATDGFRAVEQQLRSEQAFQRGKELLRLGRTEAAGLELARALDLKPTSAECALFAVWARHAAASDELSPGARSELRECATAALRENTNLAFGYFVMGEVLRAAGDGDGARHEFRRALRLEPQFFAGTRIKRFGVLPTSRASGADLVPMDSTTAPPPAANANDATPLVEAPELRAKPADTAEAVAPPKAAVVTPAKPAVVAPAKPAPATAAAKPVGTKKAKSRLAPLVLVLAGVMAAAAVTLTFLEGGGGGAPVPTATTTATAATATARPSTSASPPVAEGGPLALPADAGRPALSASIAPLDAGAAPLEAGAAPLEAGAAPLEAGAAPLAAAADASSPAIDPQRGVLVLPASATDHRVFIDGRVAVVTNSRVTVACGRHEVRIGSQGRSIPVDVSCGRETVLP